MYPRDWYQEVKTKLKELPNSGSSHILLFLLGYMNSSGKRDGHAAFMEGIQSGLIEYGEEDKYTNSTSIQRREQIE